jgi:hypothetical protein
MIIIYTLSVEYNRIGLPSRVQYAAAGAVEQNYPGNTQDFRLLQLRFNGENAAKFIHSKNNIFRQSKK